MSSKNSKQAKHIPAVGYLRKSTKGQRKDGKERQEKSIPQQKAEIIKLGKGQFDIVGWFTDEGVSGWKRGTQRPDFARMLQEVSKLGAQAILVDNLDRFSRAAVDEVQEDASALRKAGVRYIVTASHGTYDLGDRYSIGEILKFVVAIWSACEYSRQLGRRVALARRNAAVEGRRTGGKAAYGLVNDGKGGLRHGNQKEVKVVQRIFDLFVNRLKSINEIVGDLNIDGIPAPRGVKWSCNTVAQVLRRRCYRGDFTFNEKHSGQFFAIDDKGEVVEATEVDGAARKLFVREGCYKPLIDPALFDKAQRRINTISKSRSRRRLEYALSGIMVCDRCGYAMAGSKQHGNVVYTCGNNANHGRESCEYYTIREDLILPFILRLLGEGITDIRAMLTAPPDELREPNKERNALRKHTENQRAALAVQIAKAEENLMFSDDPRTRKSLDQRVSAMRDELEQLDAELSVGPTGNGYTKDDLVALTAWWDGFQAKAVSVPVTGKLPWEACFWQDRESEEQAIMIDPRIVNEALHELGAEVGLRWRTEEYKTSGGVLRRRHVLERGRFQLGKRSGRLPIASINYGQYKV